MEIKFSLAELSRTKLFYLLQYPERQIDNRLSALGSVSVMPPFKALGTMSAKRCAHRSAYLKWLYSRISSHLKVSVVTALDNANSPDSALELKQFLHFKRKSVTLSLQVRHISRNICELPQNTILFIPLTKFGKRIIYDCLLLCTAVVLQ